MCFTKSDMYVDAPVVQPQPATQSSGPASQGAKGLVKVVKAAIKASTQPAQPQPIRQPLALHMPPAD